MRVSWIAAAVLLLGQAVLGGAAAQTYPNRPITLVVPFPAGGAADVVARLIAPGLGERLGQAVVVENRPGAAGIIGAQHVARAAADGHTLLVGNSGTHGTLPNIHRSLPYDALKDFTMIGLGARFPLVMVIGSGLPPRSLAEFLTYAREQNTEITYGTSGQGSTLHIAGELLGMMADLKTLHVPFRGESLALVEVMAGRVITSFPAAGGAVGQIRAGALRPLGVTGAARLPALPDVPTMAEAGLPGFELGVWYGVMGPANLPRNITERVGAELQRVVGQPAFAAAIREQGGEAVPLSPEAFDTFVREQIERIGQITRPANIVLD